MRPGVGTTPVRVLCGTHGNERLGPKLHELLEREPIPGVQSRIAHPEAVKQGLRFLGVSQLRQHYPGSQYGDPEDQAAYWNMQWLGSEAGSESSLVIDIHNTTASPKSYLAVGPQVLRAAIVSGWMLGYNKGIVQDEPFIRTVPNAIAIEASCLSDSDEHGP